MGVETQAMTVHPQAGNAFIQQAVTRHRAASARGILERLFARLFDGLVYTQIWEDPRVDREALALDGQSRIMTISSAGCNVLNYLLDNPARIHGVDFNRHHIHLTALKIAALQHLPSYRAFYDFCGFADKPGNVDNYYRYIHPHLDESQQRYWSHGNRAGRPRIRLFQENLYRFGTTARFLRMLHLWVKLTGRDPEALLGAGTLQRQRELHEIEIDPFFEQWPVKLAGRLPFILYSLGIPPRQFDDLKAAAQGNLISLYRERVRRLACDFRITDNYFAWQAFGRRYDHRQRGAVPDYLAPAHYDTVRSRLDRIRLHANTLHRFLQSMPDRSLNRFVLLDAQDWMTGEEILRLWREIDRTAMPGSRVIFRAAASNAHVEAALDRHLRSRFIYRQKLSEALSRRDRAAIYGGFYLYKATS